VAAISEFTTVHVSLAERSYDIVIGAGVLTSFAGLIAPWYERLAGGSSAGRAAIITDQNVETHARTVADRLSAAGWETVRIVLEPGERTKRQDVVTGVYDRLVEMKADRRTLVIAVGGGVIGDTAGFVAATFARGLPFVQAPTSLLADVDSSVGGKVGINHPLAKNLIGAFHQPLGVVIDTDVLRTLPDREYRSGLAEVVKYGVILDAEFFEYLEAQVAALDARDAEALAHAIARSCQLKADVVERDEFETIGLRAVLNYGHTFAHAFEALCGYGELLHGEAVSIGMVYASRLAERLGRIDATVTQRQVDLFHGLNLPTSLPEHVTLSEEDVIERMKLDKKSVAGRLRFVLPTRMGHVELVDDVPEEDVRAVLRD
jgi:3-dehydroquinate synthase